MFKTAVILLVVNLCAMTCSAAEPTLISTQESLFDGEVSYLGQPATEGVLVLNANNGFFDKGAFRAEGQQPAPDDDKQLISAHFDHLVRAGQSEGSLRWYVWTPKADTIDVSIYMDVPRSENGRSWRIAIDEEMQTFSLGPGSKDRPQAEVHSFRIAAGGKHTVELCPSDASEPSNVKVFGLVLRGNAVNDAALLRARWRPAAVHTQYHSSTCPTTRMWVFESQSISDVPSYSPITTRFGYFGGSFTAARTADSGINFSMWAAGRDATTVPSLNQMPHLLATGHPDAEFSGFGHEGSGVKIRNWEPYAHHPRSIIQALRVETADGYDTYTGYLFDEQTERWVLYAQGRTTTMSKQPGEQTNLRANSFCEVPGPPNVERTGDRRRAMRRRGWFWGEDQKWHAVDRQTVAIKRGEAPINKFIGVDDDGWLVMGTGGLEMLNGQQEVHTTAPKDTALPVYLQPKKTADLMTLPVDIGPSEVTDLTASSAAIRYQLGGLASNATATLAYGTRDCVTFVSRELHGTERKGLSEELLSNDRTWAFATKPTKVSNGQNTFLVSKLKSGQTYYYRLLVVDNDGKVWSNETGHFVTN